MLFTPIYKPLEIKSFYYIWRKKARPVYTNYCTRYTRFWHFR